jgi:MFS family permease
VTWRGIFADRYWAAVALVVFALVPYLALSSALTPLTPLLSHGVHLSTQALQLTSGMANAAYAVGTVIAVQIAVHYPQRRMLVLYAALFVLGSLLCATALTPGLFIAGHVMQGLFTSMMLIAAVPPLVIGWPPSRLPITAAIMNLGIFGAVAAGPVIGGVQAGAGAWRPLFFIVAGVGALALVMALLTFEDVPGQEPEAPRDWMAILLAGAGCAAAFFGASELDTHRMLDLIVFAPLLAGVALLVALVVYEYFAPDPLMPVRKLVTTFPLAGIAIAMSAGAASVAVIELTQTAFAGRGSPTHTAMLFLPEFGGAVLTAFVFGAIVRTRLVPLFALAGMALLGGGAAVLTGAATGPDTLVIVGSGLVGLGVGSSVSPALFMTGFSLRSVELQRVFALLELLRGVAAFLCGPIVLHLAMTTGDSTAGGMQIAVWVCFAIAATGGLLALSIIILGRPHLQRPDIERWESGEAPAWHSPRFAEAIRGPKAQSAQEALVAWEAQVDEPARPDGR